MYNGDFSNDFEHAGKLGKKLLVKMQQVMNNVDIIHSEVLDGEIAKLLDKYSGIDAVYKIGNDVGGIALRCQQHSNRNWETFTIRYERSTGTETSYSKRKREIYEGYPSFYPHITAQGYFNDFGNFLGGGMCYTKDLFDIAKGYEPFDTKRSVYLQTNGSDNNTFIVVPFNKLDKIKIL
ncbi:MAG TPA: hypothetical protein VK982_15430 [Bacteroidales bacterium]|nr:hypothetical protein [Bacteroidales bacterium]